MAEPVGIPAPCMSEAGAEMPPSLALLQSTPERFGLFAALRLIESAYPGQPRLGEARRARDEPVRLGQPPHLFFPPSAIAGFDSPGRGHPPRLTNYAFGLFGPQGPLPLHISRDAFSRARHSSDATFADFCDLFHHRLLALYWRAYAKARPAVEQDRPEKSRFRNRIGAVAGLPGPVFFGRTALPDNFSLFAAGLLALQTRPPEAITRLISLFFAVPVKVREFVGAWLDIPPHAQTRIGFVRGNSRLGQNIVVGSRVYARHHRFRLILGPLSLTQFLEFLPNQDARTKLDAMVRQVPGIDMDWDVQLVLRPDQVPKTMLGVSTRLGWTSWLDTRHRIRDADDLVLVGNA
jgi:type VI secretion system protein ImpH